MKTAALQDWPTSSAVGDVRVLLAPVSYHRRYIPNFASVANPLTGLAKKDVKPVWDGGKSSLPHESFGSAISLSIP